MKVTKDAALLYSLGLLDETRSRAIEKAQEVDPVLRHWLRLADPDAIDPPEALFQFAADEGNSVPSALAYPQYGGIAYTFMPTLAGDSGAEVEVPVDGPSIREKAGVLRVSYPKVDDVPYAAVRVTATVDGKLLQTIVKRMVLTLSNSWVLQLRTTYLFPEGRPKTGKIRYYVQPACDKLLGWFSESEITALLAELPPLTSDVSPQLEETRTRLNQLLVLVQEGTVDGDEN
jgi:hypothetical protein